MRLIPKKVRIKNTVWKCYSFVDILVALAMAIMIFIAISGSNWIFAIILGIITAVMFMPTPDGIFYTYVFTLTRFLCGRKKYVRKNSTDKKSFFSEKANVETLCGIKTLKGDGIIEYRNGYFGRVVKIGQKNFHIEDEDLQNADIEFFANALKCLDGAQCADLVKIDRPVNLDAYSKEYYDRLVSLRGSTGKSHEIKEAILKERIDIIDHLNNLQREYISDYYIVFYSRSEADAERLARSSMIELSKSGISVRTLGLRETAVFLKYSFSRDFDERDVYDIEEEKLLEWALPNELSFSANHYTVDGLEAAIYAISDFPLYVYNAWGSNLFNIPNTKVVMHVSAIEKDKAIRRIDRVIGEMETKQLVSDRASEANEASTHRETMQALLDSLQRENESLLDVTLTVTAYNYEKQKNYKNPVRREIVVDNFKVTTLYGMQAQGFETANVSPVSKLKNYTTGINSSSLAAVFPFVRTCCMDKGGILLGLNYDNGYPFLLNIWKRDSLHQNSNAMVIGQSGSGKSFFLMTLILNEWSNGTRVIVLDPEAEYLALTENLHGNVIDVGSARQGRINPFHIYRILTEDGTLAPPAVTFHTHLKMLESFFRIVLEEIHPDVLELINNLVVEVYAEKGITEETDCSELAADDFPLFSDLLEHLQRLDKSSMDDFAKQETHSAELYLKKFVSGRYSDIWNAPSTLTVDSDIIDFNFQSLFATKNNIVANAQMLLVFRFIEQEIINARERNKAGEEVRTLLVIDEAHLFIDAKFPIALDFFYSMNKRIRKYGGSFIPATQNIADWTSNDTIRSKSSTILKNSQYTFIFKLSSPDMDDVMKLYRAGDSFNEDERTMIMRAETGQAFFVGSSEFRSSIMIQAGELAQELFKPRGGAL